MIGYEFEFLVREGNRPLSRGKFSEFHKKLSEQGWEPKYDPGTGGLIGSKKDGFYVTSDDGVCLMEINTPPLNTIKECDKQMKTLLGELQKIYRQIGCCIIGISTFPGFCELKNKGCSHYCIDEYCCNKNYIKHFNAKRFSGGHHALFYAAANQVWLDVSHEELMKQWQIFMRLSPIIYALFANGPILNNEKLEVLEGRDVCWDIMMKSSVVGSDERFFGLTPKLFDNLIDYFDFILSMPFFFETREDKGYKMKDNNISYRDFFLGSQFEAEFFDGKEFIVKPEKSDFLGLQQKTFPHVRIKYKIKEEASLEEIIQSIISRDGKALLKCLEQVFLEVRSISAQPLDDVSAGPAFVLGIQENILEAEKLLNQKQYSFWCGFYGEVQKSGLDAVYEDVVVSDLAKEFLKIAKDGLVRRGFGEENYLSTLEERINKKQNPSQELLGVWGKDGLEGIFKSRDFLFK